MKQILFLSLTVALAMTVNAQDTLIMKNGTRVGGKFISGDGGVIYMKNAAGATTTYKTDEVASMMFCTPTKGNGPSYSTSAGSHSNAGGTDCHPCDEQLKGKGSISFQCNMCSGEGRLEIKNDNRNEKDGALFLVTLDKDHHCWINKQVLMPGSYTWTYTDTGNNASSGAFTIRAGEQRKIILFEKEN